MLQNKNSKAPPKVMTWGRALPVILLSLVFDAFRLLFEMFWFFGPALGALFCTLGVSDYVGTTVASIGGKAIAGVCTGIAGAAGFFGAPVIEAIGVVMAIAVGLFGWMTVGLILIMTNARIFKENTGHSLWFIGSLLVSEIPLVGAIPALTGTMCKMYHAQIKNDKEVLAKYKKTQAREESQERQQQIAIQMQAEQTQTQTMQTQQQLEETKNVEDGKGGSQPDIPEYRPIPTRTMVVPKLATVPDYRGTNETSPSYSQKLPEVRNVSAIGKEVKSVNVPQESNVSKLSEQTYEQGIMRLQKDVLSTENEHTEVFVVKKDGTSSWLKVPENEKNSTTAGESTSGKFIKSIMSNKDVERFDIVHTHPLQSIISDEKPISRIQKGKVNPLTIATPPSIGDVLSTVVNGENNKINGHKIGTVVVDPSGIWRVEVGDDPKIILSAKKSYDESVSIADELVAQEDVKKVMGESKEHEQRPGPMMMKLSANSEKLSKKTKALAEALKKNFKEMSEIPNMGDFISKIEMASGQNVILDTDEKLKEMQAIYSGIGVNLTFTPHSKESGEIPGKVREAM